MRRETNHQRHLPRRVQVAGGPGQAPQHDRLQKTAENCGIGIQQIQSSVQVWIVAAIVRHQTQCVQSAHVNQSVLVCVRRFGRWY